MSNIGFGALGVRSKLLDFEDTIERSDASKIVAVEIRPTREVTDWTLDSGSAYSALYELVRRGERYDIVGVKSLIDSELTRVETLADCVSTAGSYFYDAEEPSPSEVGQSVTWDDGTLWDSGLLWDQNKQLFIHLSDGSNPGLTTVVVQHPLFYASEGITAPSLGATAISNSDFESWAVPAWDNGRVWDEGLLWDRSEQLPVSWTETGAGSNGTVTEETTTVYGQGSSLKLVADNDTLHGVSQATTVVTGGIYRVSGAYLTPAGATQDAAILLFDGTDYYGTDLRSVTGSAVFHSLGLTDGEWKRFSVDVRSAADTLTTTLVLEDNGTAYFDDVNVQRCYRLNYYEPRVSSSDIPSVTTGSNDIFFGGKKVSVGSVSINNNDGALEELLHTLEFMNAELFVYSAGSLHGEQLPVESWSPSFTALVQRIDCDDEKAVFDCQDARAFFHTKLPKRVYDDQTFSDLDTLRFQGKPRPLFFGVKKNIQPARIDFTSTLYGVYEFADTEEAPNGCKAVDRVYAYLSETDAKELNAARRLTLTVTTDYTVDLANGRITVVDDVGPYEVTDENNQLDWNDGGGAEVSPLTPGLYTAAALATAIETAMDGDTTDEITVTHSDVTKKFTIASDGSALTLLIKSGSNATLGPWKLLGFDPSADRSGSLAYTSDNVTFSDVDKDHVIRMDAQGYKDDASGTYTGTANNLIEVGSDITRTVLLKFMNKPSRIIDTTSFASARARAPESLTIYMNESMDTRTLFDTLEFSNICNIVVRADGKVSYNVYVGTVPPDIKTIRDGDISSFSASVSTNEVFRTIRVLYDRDPTLNTHQARETTDEGIAITAGRPEVKEFNTFLKSASNAINVSARMLELCRSPPRKLKIGTAAGRFIRLDVGQKVRVERKRGLGVGGKVPDEVFRVISVNRQPSTGQVALELTDDRITVASTACITACQSFCESTCQATCQVGCQGQCETACQSTCETACQEVCQQTCQSTCQLGCQTTCETVCQDACQQSCQGACEGGGCQTACEASCQTSCETVCQETCESACQSSCQLSCQTGCEVASETEWETECQTSCEASCQDTCELTCQTSCELTCQSACESTCQTPSESI